MRLYGTHHACSVTPVVVVLSNQIAQPGPCVKVPSRGVFRITRAVIGTFDRTPALRVSNWSSLDLRLMRCRWEGGERAKDGECEEYGFLKL
jgi:hypothetical protein